jgi:hypothetical protein
MNNFAFSLRGHYTQKGILPIAVSRGIFVNVALGLGNELQRAVFVLEILPVVCCTFHDCVFIRMGAGYR